MSYLDQLQHEEHIKEAHQEMVRCLVKSPSDILATLTPIKVNLIHAAMGIASEAGELLDAVKKHTIYNKNIDYENVVEELGDLEFYMEQIRQQTGIIREETLQANMNKLAQRYKDFKYTDQQAHDRADKIKTMLCESCKCKLEHLTSRTTKYGELLCPDCYIKPLAHP